MKSFSKISSVIIVAAVAAVFTSIPRADEAVVKPLRYQPPPKAQFTEKISVKTAVSCPACKNEFVPTLTQDSKLKMKTTVIAKHSCEQCKTTIVRTGAQKATGKDAVRHTCGALLASAETCCAGMK